MGFNEALFRATAAAEEYVRENYLTHEQLMARFPYPQVQAIFAELEQEMERRVTARTTATAALSS